MKKFNSEEQNDFEAWLKKSSVYCPFCKTKHEIPESKQILLFDLGGANYRDSLIILSCANGQCPVGIFHLTTYSVLEFYKRKK